MAIGHAGLSANRVITLISYRLTMAYSLLAHVFGMTLFMEWVTPIPERF